MKKTLRKIKIGEQEFIWTLKGTVHPGGGTGTLSLRIYLSGETKYPLHLSFTTWDDPVIGYPLNFGYALYNRHTAGPETLNLNQPSYIKKIILHALGKGWTGRNKTTLSNGLSLLHELGYDVHELLPHLPIS